MTSPTETQTLDLQLGDIIQIDAPDNPGLDQRTFLVDYIDSTDIRLLDTENFAELSLRVSDGNISDESILGISILDRPEEEGYARQNGLLKGKWVDSYFTKGDMPVVITGEITDLEQDMIEIKTYPEGKTIYIDFGYKGMPKALPLEKIVVRDKPAQIQSLQKEDLSAIPEQDEYLAVETPVSSSETVVQEPSVRDFKSELASFIANVDQIKLGDDLGAITEVVELDDEHKRYGLEKQTNDLLDDLLSRVPMAERTRSVLNEIHLEISRFRQLRQIFSSFDQYNNIIGAVKKGADYKPLVSTLEKLDTKLYWVLPVGVSRKKIYNMGAVETDEISDIVPMTLAQSRIAEYEITEAYKTNAVPSGENKLDFLYQSLQPMMTPFDPPASMEGLLGSLPVGTDIAVIQDNTRDDFTSITVGEEELRRFQYMVTNYTRGLTRLEQDKEVTIPGEYRTKVIGMTRPDTVAVKSFLMLPEPAIMFSRVGLPGSSIMLKSSLAGNFMNYWQLLTPSTFVNPVVVDELDSTSSERFKATSAIGDDGARFASVTEYMCSEDIDDQEKLTKFLQTIVPRTRTLFNLLKPYITGKLSLTSVTSVLEPFMVYYHDLSYKLYEEIALYLDAEILEFKKKFLAKAKEFNMLSLHRYRNKAKVTPLIASFAEDPDLARSVLEEYLRDSGKDANDKGPGRDLTTSEILFRIIKEDAGRYYSSLVAYATLPLHMNFDIEALLQQAKQKPNPEAPDADLVRCKKLAVSKKYSSVRDMELDDGNPAVYFDPSYDETRYDILKEYKNEQKTMPPEEFEPFLVSRLRETVGLNLEDASRDARAMISGKRIVEDGDLAIVPEEIDSGSGNFVQVIYERKNSKWEKSDIDPGTVANEGSTTCNISGSCFQINKECLDGASATDEIRRHGLEEMVKEFDDQFSYSLEELSKVVELNLSRNKELLPRLSALRRKDSLRYNDQRYKIGAAVAEGDIVVSPAAAVRDYVLGQEDIVKRNSDILLFVDKFCRAPLEDEDRYWYYCNKTHVKLLPSFIYQLAVAFNKQQNGGDFSIYSETLDRICNEQGVPSDDGNSYVDKHSGYEIRLIEADEEEGFDAGGRKIVSRAAMEGDLGTVVMAGSEPTLAGKAEDPDTKIIRNIVTSVGGFIGIDLSDYVGFIARNTLLVISRTLSSEVEHEKKVKLMAAKGKKIPSYSDIKAASILLLTLGGLLISIQTSIPPIRTRKTFPGCVRSFSGFPFSGDTDFSALEYISCVAYKMKSDVPPWNSIKGMNQSSISKKIKDLIIKYMLPSDDVRQKFEQRREYNVLNESEYIPLDHDIGTWVGFLPPVRISGLELQKPLTKEAESILIDSVRRGSPKQGPELQAVRGKIIYHSFEIQALVHKVVEKQTPLLTNSAQEPFLINSCCNESDLLSTVEYFAAKEPDVLVLNERVRLLQLMVSDMRFFAMAPLVNDVKDTRALFPPLSTQFSEETVYRAFIVFCKYNNNLPLEPELLRICTDKPKQFDKYEGLTAQISSLKKSGKNFDNQMLDSLLMVVNARNTFVPDVSVSPVSAIQEIQDLLRTISDNDNSLVSPEFVDKFNGALDTFDLVADDDSSEMRSLKNFLATSSDILSASVSSFLTKHTAARGSALEGPISLLSELEGWSPLRGSMAMSGEDNTMFRMVDFTRNMMRNLIDVVPTIVLNKVDYESVKIPKHWNVSEKHESDLKKMIARYYSPLKKFYDDPVVTDVLEQVSRDGAIYVKLCNLTPTLSSPGASDQKPLFNAELVYLLFKYYALNAAYQFVVLTDSPKFAKEVQPAVALALGDTPLGQQSDLLEELATDTVSEVEIVRGESLQLKERVASFLLAVLGIEAETKDSIDLNYDKVMERVLRAKEKEKDLITSFLRDLTDEERELENLFKNNKLERWSKGLQKGVTQYVKGTYDEEREEMESQIRRERLAGESNVVSNMNLNIYSMELQESENAISQIEREVNDMSGLPEDDDYGDADGDEGY